MVDPRDVVVITRARLQEVVDGAVARGRMSRADAAELLDELITVPRDLAHRVSGRLPIPDYDDLTAAEVVRELDGVLGRHPRVLRACAARAAQQADGAHRSSSSSSAFCAWRRFSAWSQIRCRGP